MAHIKRKFTLTDFNGKAGDKSVARVFALASEVSPKSKGLKLLPAAEVVETLLQKGFITKNRAALVHHEYTAAHKEPEKFGLPPALSHTDVLGALAGKSNYGVNYYPLAVGGRNNKEKLLMVIEDTVTGRAVVLGDKADKPRRDVQGDVAFIARGSGAKEKLLKFFLEGARHRGEKNMLSAGKVHEVIQSLITSYTMIGDPPKDLAQQKGDSLIINENTTIHDIVSRSKLNPRQYHRIVR